MIKKIAEFVVNKRIAIVVLVLAFAALCGYWTTKIEVNYDFIKYLQSDTDSVKAIDAMKEEFGMTGTSEVMVKNLTLGEAKEIQGRLADVEGIKTVNFFNTPVYFLDEDGDGTGDALFKLFFDGDDYSVKGENVVSEIGEILKDHDIAFNGALVQNVELKNRIQEQIPMATAVAVLVAAIILILTSKSWFEALIVGVMLGVAVVINLGTNYLLGEISFVTQSIAAILQLALTIDYSLMLLHQYREELSFGAGAADAMKNALAKTASPISSSALTTVAGLGAIMLMSFTLGFDIGLVLSKAVLCSMVSVFLLMPPLVVIFAKQIKKSEHKDIIKEPNKKNTRFAKGINKIKKPAAVFFALVLIGSYFVQTGVNFIYLETAKDMVGKKNAVEERFGYSNLMMVMTPKAETDEDYAKHSALVEWLKTQTNSEGKPVYRDALSTVTLTRRPVNASEAANLLGIDEKLTGQLFGMYYLERGIADGGAEEMSMKEFSAYLNGILSGKNEPPFDFDIREVLGEETADVLTGLLGFIDEGINADGLYAFLQNESVKNLGIDLSGLPKEYINQIFGMYYAEKGLFNEKASLREVINYLDEKLENPGADGIDVGAFLTEDEKTAVRAFAKLLNALNDETGLSPGDFYGVLTDGDIQSLGISFGNITEAHIKHVYAYYNFQKFQKEGGVYKISVCEFVGYLNEIAKGGAEAEMIKGILGETNFDILMNYVSLLNGVIGIIPQEYTPDELFDMIQGGGLDGAFGLSFAEFPKGYIKQLYGMYYYANGFLDDAKFSMYDLIKYLAEASAGDAESNVDLNALLGNGGADVLRAAAFMLDLALSETPVSPSAFFEAEEFEGILNSFEGIGGYINHIYAYYNFKQMTGDYKITPGDFIVYLCGAARGAENVKTTLDIENLLKDTGIDFELVQKGAGMLEAAIALLDNTDNTYTPEEFQTAIKSRLSSYGGDAADLAEKIDIAYINQIFGMYYYHDDRMNGDGYDKINMKNLLAFGDGLVSGDIPFPIDVKELLGENAAFLRAAKSFSDILQPSIPDQYENEYTYDGLYTALTEDKIKNAVDITNIDGKGTGITKDYLEILYAWKQYKKHGMTLGTLDLTDAVKALFKLADMAGRGIDSSTQSLINVSVAGLILFNPDKYKGLTWDKAADTIVPLSGGQATRETVELAYAVEFFEKQRIGVSDNAGDLFAFVADEMTEPGNPAYLGIVSDMLKGGALNLLKAAVKMSEEAEICKTHTEMAETLNGYAEVFGLKGENGKDAVPDALVKQLYILYWGNRGFSNMENNKKPRDVVLKDLLEYLSSAVTPESENFEEFIYNNVLVPVLSGFVKEGAPKEDSENEAKKLIALAAGIFSDVDKNLKTPLTYAETAEILKEYMSVLATDGEIPVTELTEQAYAMYYYNAETEKALKGVLLTDLAKFLGGLIDENQTAYNPVIADALGENADAAAEIFGIVKELYGDINKPLSVSETVEKLTEYTSGMDGALKIDGELIEQACILYLSANDYKGIGFERAVAVADILGVISGSLENENGLIYGIVFGTLAGENPDETKIAETKETIETIKNAALAAAFLNTQYDIGEIASLLEGLSEIEGLDFDIGGELIEQAFVMYFSGKGETAAEPIGFLETVRYIRDLIDGDGKNDNALIAGFLGADLKDALILAEKLAKESGDPVSYEDAGALIEKYLNGLNGADPEAGAGVFGETDFGIADGADYTALMLQAYIMYAGNKNTLPAHKAELTDIFEYAVSLTENGGGEFGSVIEGLLDGLFDGELSPEAVSELTESVRAFLSGTNSKKTYTDLANEINLLAEAVKGIAEDAETAEIDARLFEQVYVMKMLEENTLPTEKVTVSDLVSFLYEIIDDDIVSGFIDGGMRAEIDDYRDSLNTAEAMFNGKEYSRMVFTFDLPASGDEAFAFTLSLKAKAEELFGRDARIAGNSVVLKDISVNFEKDTVVTSVASIIFVFLIIALIYKSFMIPVILVLLIQAATWIAFSMAVILGEPVYFMAYTVVSCIQMGAAVDYGILLSTKYLYNRKFMNKKDAAGCAVKDSLKTILTSGSIMVIAGFILYIASTTLVLSSIGMYIFRGVGMSILMTIFILPALLLIFDGWIEKTTKNADFYKGGKTIDGGDFKFKDENGVSIPLERQTDEKGGLFFGSGETDGNEN
ncbi:MAG: MMPL family transporter [Clostridiales bacterium]|jgi:predicted RND superfamily exporter protein|nr:MMPL family transporter [Clostridiales bacterium]